jgi:hypothetical protein
MLLIIITAIIYAMFTALLMAAISISAHFEHDESNVVLCSQVGTNGIPSQVALGVPCPSQADASGASRPQRYITHHASAQPAHEEISASTRPPVPKVPRDFQPLANRDGSIILTVIGES